MHSMTISPLQFNNDHVTKGEFMKHKEYITDGFRKVFEQVDNVESIITNRIDVLESNMIRRFDSMDNKFTGIYKRFEGIDKRFDCMDLKLGGLDVKINNITNLLNKSFDYKRVKK